MTSYLLDTDAVIDYFKGYQPTIGLIQQLSRQGDELCSCDIVVAEVHAGLTAAERPQGDAFFSALRFVPTSPAAARRAGQWRFEYARRGKQLPTTDCLVAAIAHEHLMTVVTGNRADFPMPELSILLLSRDIVDKGGGA